MRGTLKLKIITDAKHKPYRPGAFAAAFTKATFWKIFTDDLMKKRIHDSTHNLRQKGEMWGQTPVLSWKNEPMRARTIWEKRERMGAKHEDLMEKLKFLGKKNRWPRAFLARKKKGDFRFFQKLLSDCAAELSTSFYGCWLFFDGERPCGAAS